MTYDLIRARVAATMRRQSRKAKSASSQVLQIRIAAEDINSHTALVWTGNPEETGQSWRVQKPFLMPVETGDRIVTAMVSGKETIIANLSRPTAEAGSSIPDWEATLNAVQSDIVNLNSLKADTSYVNALVGASATSMQALFTPPLQSGRWYNALDLMFSQPSGSSASRTATANRYEAYTFRVGRTVSLSGIGVSCTTFSSAGNVRLGIHSIASDGKSGAVLADSGDIAVAGTGAVSAAISVTLNPGLYNLAFRSEAANAFSVFPGTEYPNVLGAPTIGGAASKLWIVTGSTGAFVANPGGTINASNPFLISVEVA